MISVFGLEVVLDEDDEFTVILCGLYFVLLTNRTFCTSCAAAVSCLFQVRRQREEDIFQVLRRCGHRPWVIGLRVLLRKLNTCHRYSAIEAKSNNAVDLSGLLTRINNINTHKDSLSMTSDRFCAVFL